MLTRTAIMQWDAAAAQDKLRQRTWPSSLCLAREYPVNTSSTVFSFCHNGSFGSSTGANQLCICLNGMLSDTTYNGGLTLSTRFVLPAQVRRREGL
jgi:hypothetical protein